MRRVCAAGCFLLLLWHLTPGACTGQRSVAERVTRYILCVGEIRMGAEFGWNGKARIPEGLTRFGVFPRKGSGWRPRSALGTRCWRLRVVPNHPNPALKVLRRGCNHAKQIHAVSNTGKNSCFRRGVCSATLLPALAD